MKKFIFSLCFFLSAATFFDAVDAKKEALIRGFEKNYRNCMERQDSTIAAGENCINDLTNNLVNYNILPQAVVRQRKLDWIFEYQKALGACRRCERSSLSQTSKKKCYDHKVGITGFTLLNKVGLSADKIIANINEIEREQVITWQKEQEALLMAQFYAEREKAVKDELVQSLEHQLTQCYQRAGNNNAAIQDCWQLYRESMQTNGLQVAEDRSPQRNEAWTLIALITWPFRGW